VNWQQIIRNLVVDGGLRLDDVLDMNPRQIMAILTEKSVAPGLLKPDMYVIGLKNMRERLYVR